MKMHFGNVYKSLLCPLLLQNNVHVTILHDQFYLFVLSVGFLLKFVEWGFILMYPC